jgi:ABC-type uncharacterized transport system permease subunit
MITSIFASLCYCLTATALLVAGRFAVWAGGLALLAMGMHALTLLSQGVSFQFFDALSWVSLVMAALAAPGAFYRRWRILAIGAFVIGAIAVLLPELLVSSVRPRLSWQIELHAGVALAAYAALSLAALQAMLVWHQESALRKRRPPFGGRIQLPPLSAMETTLFRWIQTGFALLSLTLLSGMLFINDWFAQHLVHKTVLTSLAWGVFAALLIGHWRAGWRGRQAARWTLAGMALLLLAFFGSKFVLEVLLGLP